MYILMTIWTEFFLSNLQFDLGGIFFVSLFIDYVPISELLSQILFMI